ASSSSRSRVTPGKSCTKARRRPSRRLNKVLLPAFGRPTIASFGGDCCGLLTGISNAMIAQALQTFSVSGPIFKNLHSKAQVNFLANKFLDLAARRLADLFDHPRVLANDHRLLRFTLDIDHRLNPRRRAALVKLL